MAEHAITAADAVRWVDQNKGLIVIRAGKYIPFTPYDRDDFVQDAYEAAIVAACVANKKRLPFEACFWTTFKLSVRSVVPNPFSTRHSGSTSPSSTLCDDVEKHAGTLRSEEEDNPWHDVDRLYLAICEFLSDSEKRVWARALGLTSRGRMSTYEIAEDLGCSAANVRQAIQRVIVRLSKQVKTGVLRLSLASVEARHLAVVSGQTRKPPASREKPRKESPSPNFLAEVG